MNATVLSHYFLSAVIYRTPATLNNFTLFVRLGMLHLVKLYLFKFCLEIIGTQQ